MVTGTSWPKSQSATSSYVNHTNLNPYNHQTSYPKFQVLFLQINCWCVTIYSTVMAHRKAQYHTNTHMHVASIIISHLWYKPDSKTVIPWASTHLHSDWLTHNIPEHLPFTLWLAGTPCIPASSTHPQNGRQSRRVPSGAIFPAST